MPCLVRTTIRSLLMNKEEQNKELDINLPEGKDYFSQQTAYDYSHRLH